jgi:hypothetical protein
MNCLFVIMIELLKIILSNYIKENQINLIKILP